MRIAYEIPPGLNGDDTTYSANGRYGDGSNVRFWRGKPQTINGWEAISTTALTGVCRSVLGWTNNAAVLNLAFGTHSNLQLYQGGAVYDITPAGLPAGNINGTGGAGYGTGTYSTGTFSSPSTVDYFPRTWSLSSWGQELIANPRGGGIYNWQTNTATPAAILSNAPTQVTYAFVSQKRQVFALGCNQEASPYTFDPLIIRHSSVGNNNDWTTTASNTAREYRLPSGGRIVCGAQFGQYVLIWTASSLFLGTFVGALGQVWRFDKVGDECGIIGPNAFTIVGQQAFWVGPNLQIYAYTLGGQTQLVPCPIQNDFERNMAPAQTDKIAVSSISTFNEIRIDYPDSRDGVENSRYIAAHIPTLFASPENAWYRGIMARTAFIDAPATTNTYPVGVDPSGNFYWHEKGNTANGGPLSWYLETADNYIDPNNTMMVRALWPDFRNQIGPINFQLIGRLTPQGTSTSNPVQTLAVGQEKADVRLSARLVKVRYSGESTPSFVRFGNPTFDVVPAGQR